jgi:hypothetical protein
MSEADDVYMGYAGNDELRVALQTLMELSNGNPWHDRLRHHLDALSNKPVDVPAQSIRVGQVDSNHEVVKTLRLILPRVRDDRLHADLAGMLRDFETRISVES